MGLLTPTFADKANGNGAHIIPAHEPTREGERSLMHQALGGPFQQLGPAPIVEPQPLKVAVIGTAPSSRSLAPYGDPSWQIWSCSPGNMNQIPRFDVWFEMHSNLLWPEHESYGRPYVEWLKQGSFPLYMQDNSLVARATPYPILEMVEKFKDNFFSSSFAYMMALAIAQGAQELALYGVDMASRDEYILQRPGGRYFIQRAEELGVKVTIPYESDIGLPSPLYGYIDSTMAGRKLAARATEVAGRRTGMQNQINELQRNATYLQGAEEDIDYVRNIQLGGENERILQRARIARLEQENAQLRQLNGVKAP